MISRSAPPIPRSGWKKTMFFASAFDFSLITPVMGDVELSGSEGRKVTDDRFRELTVTTVWCRVGW
jgi:hypothetical protein